MLLGHAALGDQWGFLFATGSTVTAPHLLPTFWLISSVPIMPVWEYVPKTDILTGLEFIWKVIRRGE
jgi:hypothetical protein